MLAALFAVWCVRERPDAVGFLSALVWASLFGLLCLRFVPVWLKAWSSGEESLPETDTGKKGEILKIFLAALMWDAVLVAAVTAVRALAGESTSVSFWKCTDSQHYLAIAEDWYLSEGSIDRLVQLVFLPGYPLLVRLVNLAVGDYLLGGMIASALCFAGSACLFYKLMRLDMSREKALRGLCFMCILPGAFFYAAPMSESLFMLLSLCCIYCARCEKNLVACIFGALAAFTRSVGLALMVPVLFELAAHKRKIRDYFALLVIPLGFAAYCYINYRVSGDAFKFMQYQSEHWNQRFGLFFNTAAYQTEYALKSLGENPHNFFGLWLPNLLAQLGALAIMCVAVRKIRASYSAYFIAYFFVAVGATWLLSAPRYMLVMFPLSAALAELSEKRSRAILLYAACLIFGLAYLIAFALRWQVW
ncbi:MAG: mannosyltransferase family protein [Bacillota bacterium]|nr:mannosyltransferase family protein [Bacillota bacterium]